MKLPFAMTVYKKQIAVRIKTNLFEINGFSPNCEQEHNQLQCAFSTNCLEAHLHAIQRIAETIIAERN